MEEMKPRTLKSVLIIGAIFGLIAAVLYHIEARKIQDSIDNFYFRDHRAASLNSILEGQVYQDLVASHLKGDAKNYYGAYFLAANKENTAYLRLLFSNSVPRVELGTNNLIVANSIMIDRLTQKAGKVFWARVQSVSNNVADVEAGWYTGPEGAESIQYRLAWTGTRWVTISRKTLSIS